MSSINFNGVRFSTVNPNAVRGMGPLPECDRQCPPKENPQDFLKPAEKDVEPEIGSKFDGVKHFRLQHYEV